MAKPEFPFMGGDFSKMFGDFKMPEFKMPEMGKMPDLSKMMADFKMPEMGKMPDMTKMMGDFKMPNFDMQALMQAQQKNVEVLTQANQLAAEGFQAIAKRQGEIFKETMEQAQGAMKDMMSGGSPKANASKQADLAKSTLERALSNAKEIAEMAAKSNGEAFELINKRMMASLDEMKSSMPKGGKK